MSQIYSIKNLLNIKDKNITFTENGISIQDRKFNNFKAIIEKYYSISNEIMKTSLKTFKKHLEYIENSLTYDYNNGLIEGINRKIKTIKRSAYGYKSFYHFRARILISNNLLATK